MCHKCEQLQGLREQNVLTRDVVFLRNLLQFTYNIFAMYQRHH